MKKIHKILLGGIISLIFLSIFLNGYFTYQVFQKQKQNYLELNEKITDTQEEFTGLKNNLDSSLTEIGYDILSLEDSGDFSKVIGDSIKSVVLIKSFTCSDECTLCLKKQNEKILGTGFFIYENYIVTNLHVISGGDTSSIQVETYDGKNYTFLNHTLSKVGEDASMDISLLKINSSDYPSLKLANSENIKVGEKVIAIGNPLGLEFSVSQGIISATDKKIKGRPGGYVQTDTPLNPGNSGGPLINQNGEVIGINNYKIFLTEGLGFSLESNDIGNTINEISIEKVGYRLV